MPNGHDHWLPFRLVCLVPSPNILDWPTSVYTLLTFTYCHQAMPRRINYSVSGHDTTSTYDRERSGGSKRFWFGCSFGALRSYSTMQIIKDCHCFVAQCSCTFGLARSDMVLKNQTIRMLETERHGGGGYRTCLGSRTWDCRMTAT